MYIYTYVCVYIDIYIYIFMYMELHLNIYSYLCVHRGSLNKPWKTMQESMNTCKT